MHCPASITFAVVRHCVLQGIRPLVERPVHAKELPDVSAWGVEGVRKARVHVKERSSESAWRIRTWSDMEEGGGRKTGSSIRVGKTGITY